MIEGAGGKRWATLKLPYWVTGLVLLAAWLRLWQLQAIPPGFWFDESLNALEVTRMLRTGAWPIFIMEGQGREVLFYYLLALAMWGLGGAVYVVRLVPALLGILSIPLMYRWTLAVCDQDRRARWLALLAAAGLAVSLWAVVMNRVGYRANTLLPVWLATGYFFWRGWQTGRWGYYLAAGLGLGLCQYTYLAGRLAPLVFVVFYIVQRLVGPAGQRDRLRRAGPGLLLMLVTAGLVFLPLLLFFTGHPELFWERGGDVAVKLDDSGWPAFGRQALAAVRVFIDGGDPNWRHHLVGRPGLDLFTRIGFWLGLAVAGRYFYRPAYTFLLATLAVMGLPALLSEPAFHTLRLSGLLPACYTLAGLGWLALAGRLPWLARRSDRARGLAVLAALLLFSGIGTGYDYFYRWARQPEVVRAFDGPVVELANYLAAAGSGPDVIIPYYLYAHPTLRYLLDSHFQEEVLLPAETAARLGQPPETRLVLPVYPPDDRLPPALVWLVKAGPGPGRAYVSAVNRAISLDGFRRQASPVKDSAGNTIAYQARLDPGEMLELFPQRRPAKAAAAAWAGNLRLAQYEFEPAAVEAGQPARLALAWELLDYTGLQEKMFLQVVDSRGRPVGQQELAPISRKMYRWREEAVVLEQHLLPLEPGRQAGLYFVRLGFFEPETGRRLAVVEPESGRPLGDEFIAGPLYVRAGPADPTQPERLLRASLDHKFELLGYSLQPAEAGAATTVSLYWQVSAAVQTDYTVFVQWLDPQNKVLAQVDAQPLPNLYPTSRWLPGEIISDRFVLPAPPEQLAVGRLVTGMYDLASGTRLPVYDSRGQPLADGLIDLAE